MGLINLYKELKLYKLYKDAREHPEVMSKTEFWIDVFKTAWGIEEIRNMLKALQGYKSYLVAAVAAAVTVAHMMGYIDDTLFNSLMALLGSGAVATVAAKLNRVTNK
jgi:hypothetical protein